MIDCFGTQHFIHHGHRIRAQQLGHQAWFCLADLACSMGEALDEGFIRILDSDQHSVAWLECNDHWSKQSLVSESGLYALLAQHDAPENRALRQWVTHQVLPVLREHPLRDTAVHRVLRWARSPVGLMRWRREFWCA